MPTLTSVSQASRTTQPPTEFRLSKSIQPKNYLLTLRVDFDPYSNTVDEDTVEYLPYTGEVTILLHVVSSTDRILLHMDSGLALTDPNIMILDVATQQAVQVSSAEFADNQLFKIQTASLLQENRDYSLLIKFMSNTTRYGFIYHGFEESFQRRLKIVLKCSAVNL